MQEAWAWGSSLFFGLLFVRVLKAPGLRIGACVFDSYRRRPKVEGETGVALAGGLMVQLS